MVSGPNAEDSELADILRREDPDQFHTLVRMHLSFVLDLNTDECDGIVEKVGKFRPMKWGFASFAKKSKTPAKATIDGVCLTQDGISQVYQLIEWLSKEENVMQEGIFRRSGKMTRQQELKTLLTAGSCLQLEEGIFSVHDCASVLKNFLAQLPEPLLTEAHYTAHCQIAELCSGKEEPIEEERLLKALQLILLLLPPENLQLLRDLIGLLHLTASHANVNKMSADNLATLFTPHLLCPRKLSPEALHTNSQTMSRVVSFMIKQGPALFHIPRQLATDVRAYWTTREQRKLMPKKELNESTCDGMAAKTVFTFVDRERTAEASGSANPTEAALAQLYAHIQSLPESSKKRKLIKQFNKENGQGTPQLIMESQMNVRSSRSRQRTTSSSAKQRHRSRSLGDSIKKHLPVFNKMQKDIKKNGEESCSKDSLESPHGSPSSKVRLLFQRNMDREASNPPPATTPSIMPLIKKPLMDNIGDNKIMRLKNSNAKQSTPLSSTYEENICAKENDDRSSSDSHCAGDEKSHSCLKRSTPTTSSSVEGSLNPSSEDLCAPSKSPRLEPESPFPVPLPSVERLPAKHLQGTCRDESWPEDMMTPRSRKPVVALSSSSLCQLAHLSGWGRSGSGELRRDATSRATLLSFTEQDPEPDPELEEEEEDSICIPIEKMLAKELPPNDGDTGVPSKQASNETKGCDCYSSDKSGSCCRENCSMDYYSCGSDGSALTGTFREIVLSRSVLTASPVDLSFSSHTGDFDTSSDRDVQLMLSNENMSESLLFCLDGNEPSCLNESERQSSDSKVETLSCTENEKLDSRCESSGVEADEENNSCSVTSSNSTGNRTSRKDANDSLLSVSPCVQDDIDNENCFSASTSIHETSF